MDLRKNEQANYPQWMDVFANNTKNYCLCLILLLIVDVLSNPYAGLVHDARLYALQALSHLYPGRYLKDLFFLYGSQDSFSLFSEIHALAIAGFGLYNGSWLLYVCCRVLFYSGILSFFRRLLTSNAWAFIAACLIAAGPVKYIFFEINEPFLTARLPTVGLSLLAMSLAYRNANILSIFSILVAGLLHPLMALGPGLILVIYWFCKRQWVILIVLSFCTIFIAIAIIMLRPETITQLTLAAKFDPDWLSIIRERSIYLFPPNWMQADWLTIGSGIGLVAVGYSFFSREQHIIILAITSVAILGIISTMIVLSGPQLVFPLQLQPWRFFWALQLVTPAIACIVSRKLLMNQFFFQKMAGMLIAASFLLAGSSSEWTTSWLIFAAVIMLFGPLISSCKLESNLWQYFLIGVGILIFILPLPMVISNLSTLFGNYSAANESSLIFSFPLLLGPYFRMAALAVVVVILTFFTRKKTTLLILFGLASLLILNSRQPFIYPQIIMDERNFNNQWNRLDENIDWQKHIPVGSVILIDGSLPIGAIWFDLQANSYFSKIQGAGVLFSRDLALEYKKRQQEVKQVFSNDFDGDLSMWCRKRGINFIMSRRKISLPFVVETKGIHFYSVPSI